MALWLHHSRKAKVPESANWREITEDEKTQEDSSKWWKSQDDPETEPDDELMDQNDVSEPDWGESANDLMMVDEVSWDEAKAMGNRGVSLRRIRGDPSCRHMNRSELAVLAIRTY